METVHALPELLVPHATSRRQLRQIALAVPPVASPANEYGRHRLWDPALSFTQSTPSSDDWRETRCTRPATSASRSPRFLFETWMRGARLAAAAAPHNPPRLPLVAV